jgi:hypothetical protein
MNKAAFIADTDTREHGNLRRVCVQIASAESASLDVSSLAGNVSALSCPANALIVLSTATTGGNDDRYPDPVSEGLQAIYERRSNTVVTAAALAGKLRAGEVSCHDDEPDLMDLFWEGLANVARAGSVALLIASMFLLALF